MHEHEEPSRLRLASVNRRVTAFLEQIIELKASGFPHDDGLGALLEIEQRFLLEKKKLDIPPGASAILIDETCMNVTSRVSDYTTILGFILRSTNVRNPFELHFALAELVNTSIGEGIKVLISSEWDHIPFTYPMSLDLLPDFVLIGSPAPESGNVLIAPLAGHEIGHTAWTKYECGEQSMPALVSTQVDATLKAEPKLEKKLLNLIGLGPLARNNLADRCGEYALKQLEEIFCDLFGLFVFGSSYLFAYDYFLAPGNRFCYLDYPSDQLRMKILTDSANFMSIPVDHAVGERWQKASYDSEDKDIAAIVDKVVAALVPGMRQALFDELLKRNIHTPDESTIENIVAAFKRHEPYPKKARLAEIITAGWRYLRNNNGLCLGIQRDEYKALNDLMLKSIEVAEFLERVSGDA